MLQKFQTKYELTDYQMKLLKYLLTVFFGELGKILAIGLLFINNYPVYLWCLLIMASVRTSTGGVHCRTYLGCLFASASYFLLCIDILPYIEISGIIRICLLCLCIIINAVIGPVMSDARKSRYKSEEMLQKCIKKSLLRAFVMVSCFILYTCFYPDTAVANAGFWIIMLNSIQLVIGKIKNLKKGGHHHA